MSVSGLFPGNQVVLAVDASEFTITANGDFSFEAAYSYPSDSTAIVKQPNDQTCSIGGGPAPGVDTLLLEVGCLRSGQFVYVVNSGDNSLSMYSVGADGALTPLNPATVATGQGPESIDVDSGGLFAYVANSGDNSISEFDIAPNGALSADSQGLLQQPSMLSPRSVVDFLGQNLYVLDAGNNTIVSNTIGPNGHLQPLQSAGSVSTGTGPWALAITNVNAYVTNHDDNTVSNYALDNGSFLSPSSTYPVLVVPTGRGPTGITLLGKAAYVANFDENTISQFAVDPNGRLTAMTPATVTAGNQPVFVQTGAGSHVYVVNFNAGNAGSISQYMIDANGGLSPLGSPVPTGKGPTMLILDEVGQFAYVTNSMDNTVSQYAVAADGTLTPLATAAVPAGSQPVAIAVTY